VRVRWVFVVMLLVVLVQVLGVGANVSMQGGKEGAAVDMSDASDESMSDVAARRSSGDEVYESSPPDVDETTEEVLQLPAPGEVGSSQSQSLELGETLALDHLGPIIINKDGTLRRITNWSGLTANEKKHTLRKVSLRNQKRLGVLKNAERLEIIKRYYEEQDKQKKLQEVEVDESDEVKDSRDERLAFNIDINEKDKVYHHTTSQLPNSASEEL
jgi:predicted Fe-S protein YdhL (DUF1289 family)